MIDYFCFVWIEQGWLLHLPLLHLAWRYLLGYDLNMRLLEQQQQQEEQEQALFCNFLRGTLLELIDAV